MDERAFLLALVSAIFHAVWNASLKGARNSGACIMASGTIQGFLALPIVVALGAWPQLAEAWPFVLASAGIHVAYRLTLAKALQTGSLSQAYAVARSSPLLIAFGAWLIFGETLTPGVWACMAVMLGGLALLHSRELAALLGSGQLERRSGRAAFWAFTTTLTVTAYSLTDKAGVSRMDPVAFYFSATVVMSLLFGVPQLVSEGGHDRLRAMATAWREERRIVVIVTILEPLSYSLLLTSFLSAPVGAASAVRQVSVPIVAFIGVWLFKEPAGLQRIAGAVLVALGAVGIRLWG